MKLKLKINKILQEPLIDTVKKVPSTNEAAKKTKEFEYTIEYNEEQFIIENEDTIEYKLY